MRIRRPIFCHHLAYAATHFFQEKQCGVRSRNNNCLSLKQTVFTSFQGFIQAFSISFNGKRCVLLPSSLSWHDSKHANLRTCRLLITFACAISAAQSQCTVSARHFEESPKIESENELFVQKTEAVLLMVIFHDKFGTRWNEEKSRPEPLRHGEIKLCSINCVTFMCAKLTSENSASCCLYRSTRKRMGPNRNCRWCSRLIIAI